MSNIHLNISEVAEIFDVSLKTLRRWDESGKLTSKRTEGSQRIYKLDSLTHLVEDNIFLQAKLWALNIKNKPDNMLYCPAKDVFEARNSAMERLLARKVGDVYSIISSSVGEIGNNTFDHNLGKWPDVPGLYFNYNFDTRRIVLADRGQGILKTLQYVLPGLTETKDALDIAFTEVITGCAPEKRGNGLKYVRRNVERGYFSLTFQTGNMELTLKSGELFNITSIQQTKISISGCLALIEF